MGTVVELDAFASSPTLLAVFSVPTSFLAAILFCSVVGSLLLAAIILFYQLRDERAREATRLLLEANEAKARRRFQSRTMMDRLGARRRPPAL